MLKLNQIKVGSWDRKLNSKDYYLISDYNNWYVRLECKIMDGKILKAHFKRNITVLELLEFYELANVAKVLYDK